MSCLGLSTLPFLFVELCKVWFSFYIHKCFQEKWISLTKTCLQMQTQHIEDCLTLSQFSKTILLGFPLGPIIFIFAYLLVFRFLYQAWIPSCEVGLKANQRSVGSHYSTTATIAQVDTSLPGRLISEVVEITRCLLSSSSLHSNIRDKES